MRRTCSRVAGPWMLSIACERLLAAEHRRADRVEAGLALLAAERDALGAHAVDLARRARPGSSACDR